MARARVYRNPQMRTAQGRAGAWCLDYVSIDGRRKRERTTAHTREEASALLRARLAEIDKARSLGLTSLEALDPETFRSFSKEFMDTIKATVRGSTAVRYGECLAHLLGFFGPKTLASIVAGDVEKFIVQRRNAVKHRPTCKKSEECTCSKIAPATVNRERAVLSNLLNMAMRRGLIDKNVVRAVKPLKENNARDRYLKPDEERRILEAAADWLKPLMVLAVHTGMRLGELLGARWVDVDEESAILRIPNTKNGKIRHVPLNKTAMKTIESLPLVFGAEAWLFANPETSKPWREDSIVNAFKRAVKMAGLATEGPDKVTFHTLRHTTASRLVAAGVPDRKIMKLLGHSSSAMVSRYAHLAPDSTRDAVEALEKGRFPARKGTLGANFEEGKQANAQVIAAQ